MPRDLAELERGELEAALVELGAPKFHGRQIFHWIHRRGVTDATAMTNLGRALRQKLHDETTISTPTVVSRQVSTDGTTKFLLALADGRQIEAVYIPDTPNQTFCISSQVGCAMACAFCLTGKMGLTRHVTAGEIVGQVRVLAHETGLADKPFNIVLMGMGEPLHNYDATMKAIRMLADDQGLAVHPRRITLSTVGVLPGMERLAQEDVMPNLAVSLHATTDEDRSAIVPINRKYGLEELIEACRRFPLAKRRRITFEYVLLAGVNDTPEDAVARILAERDVTVSVRRSRGRDIRAACGQLLVEGQQTSAAQKLAKSLQ